MPDTALNPDPNQPAIRYGRPQTSRRLDALRTGVARGWWVLLPPENGDARPDDIVYLVKLTGQPLTAPARRIPAPAVLDWVLGFGDARGESPAVTYRVDHGYVGDHSAHVPLAHARLAQLAAEQDAAVRARAAERLGRVA